MSISGPGCKRCDYMGRTKDITELGCDIYGHPFISTLPLPCGTCGQPPEPGDPVKIRNGENLYVVPVVAVGKGYVAIRLPEDCEIVTTILRFEDRGSLWKTQWTRPKRESRTPEILGPEMPRTPMESDWQEYLSGIPQLQPGSEVLVKDKGVGRVVRSIRGHACIQFPDGSHQIVTT